MKRSLFAASLILLMVASPTAAQTPMSSPDGCTVEPRSIDDLERLSDSATPFPEGNLEPYTIAASEIPSGGPADEKVVEEITGLLGIRAACVRAIDMTRVYALYTDRYLADLLSLEGDTAWRDQQAPQGDKPDYRLGAIEQVTLMEDGRVSAFVAFEGADIEDSQPRSGVTYLMIFTRMDRGWLIDHQYENYLDDATQKIYPIADLLDTEVTPAS